MPIKERIKWYQNVVKKTGRTLTRKQAKKLVNEPHGEMWTNGKYVVLVYDGKDADQHVGAPEFKGKCTYLSIRREDRAPIHSWPDLYAIKNHFCGKDREAIEIYPRASELIDAANQYHLFVFPEGFIVPVGLDRGVKNGR